MSQEQGASPPHRADSERSLEQREKRRAKIIAARMKLRARFQSAMRSSPAQSDLQPLGAGPPNRHGMPQTPPGQHLVHKWPVLDLGVHPLISQDDWSLKIEGLVTQPQQLRWADMLSLEQVEDRSDFHCVTTWSKLDMGWTGVRVSTLLALAEPLEEARFARAPPAGNSGRQRRSRKGLHCQRLRTEAVAFSICVDCRTAWRISIQRIQYQRALRDSASLSPSCSQDRLHVLPRSH